MSRIVLGLATSHTPLLTFGPELWAQRAQDDLRMVDLAMSDGRTLTYQELEAERAGQYRGEATAERFAILGRLAQGHLDRLADELERSAPDVVVIVGDDQEELFPSGNIPAISMYLGGEMVMHPLIEANPALPKWLEVSAAGYLMDGRHRHPAAAEYTRDLVERLVDLGVDLAVAAQVDDPLKAGFGHAYGFVVARLFRGRQIPIVPVLLNTYYPPNVPSASRCHDIGRALRSAIEASSDALRVAVVASGGLSHFATDEALDRSVMDALKAGDDAVLRAIPRAALRSGSSEILNWILAAGTFGHLPYAWGEYIPVYRTPAGTGIGLGFACWRAAD